MVSVKKFKVTYLSTRVQEIAAGKKYEIKSSNGKHTLQINDVEGKDEGKYTISFKDTELTSTASLTVKGKNDGLSQYRLRQKYSVWRLW